MMNTQTEVVDDRVLRNMSKGGPQTRPDQTNQPSPGTDHLTSGPTRQCTREGRWQMALRGGRPTPPGGVSRRFLAGTSFLSSRRRLSMFPYLLRAGTDLWSYKRGLHTPSQAFTIPISFSYTSRRRSSSSVPLVSLE